MKIIYLMVFILFSLEISADDVCESGDCQNGIGTLKYENGMVYSGNWKNSQKNGFGKETFKNFEYEGEFLNNEHDGKGTLIFPDGARYVGNFSKNEMQGKGCFTRPDGSYLDGDWVDSKPEGKIKSVLKNGTILIGDYKNGIPEGYGEESYINGSKYSGMWKQGNKHGLGKITDARGKIIIEGTFSGGNIPDFYTQVEPDSILRNDVNKFIFILENKCKNIKNLAHFRINSNGDDYSEIWIYDICNEQVGYFLKFKPDGKGGTFFEIDMKKNKQVNSK